MAAIQSVGTEVEPAVVFNSGKLTIGSSNPVHIMNISVEQTQNSVPVYALNKRAAVYHKAGNISAQVTFEVEAGIYRSIVSAFAGASSVPAAGETQYTASEGQPAQPDVYITAYENDDITKPVQFQLLNAIFTQNNHGFEQESFVKNSVTIVCTEIVTVMNDTVA